MLGDGGIYSSIEDLAKWDKALLDDRLLTEMEMRPALTPTDADGALRLPDGSLSPYGFGWYIDSYKKQRRMWHYGDTIGFHTFIGRLLDDKLTVIVLANRTDMNPYELASRVMDSYLGNKF